MRCYWARLLCCFWWDLTRGVKASSENRRLMAEVLIPGR